MVLLSLLSFIISLELQLQRDNDKTEAVIFLFLPPSDAIKRRYSLKNAARTVGGEVGGRRGRAGC